MSLLFTTYVLEHPSAAAVSSLCASVYILYSSRVGWNSIYTLVYCSVYVTRYGVAAVRLMHHTRTVCKYLVLVQVASYLVHKVAASFVRTDRTYVVPIIM